MASRKERSAERVWWRKRPCGPLGKVQQAVIFHLNRKSHETMCFLSVLSDNQHAKNISPILAQRWTRGTKPQAARHLRRELCVEFSG